MELFFDPSLHVGWEVARTLPTNDRWLRPVLARRVTRQPDCTPQARGATLAPLVTFAARWKSISHNLGPVPPAFRPQRVCLSLHPRAPAGSDISTSRRLSTHGSLPVKFSHRPAILRRSFAWTEPAFAWTEPARRAPTWRTDQVNGQLKLLYRTRKHFRSALYCKHLKILYICNRKSKG